MNKITYCVMSLIAITCFHKPAHAQTHPVAENPLVFHDEDTPETARTTQPPAPADNSVPSTNDAPEPGNSDEPNSQIEANRHVHEGFYLRLAIGIAYLSAGRSDGESGTISASGLSTEFGIGLTVTNGLAFGIGIGQVAGSNGTYESGGNSRRFDGRASLMSLKAFGDWYVYPQSGFHIKAAIGYAWLDHKSLNLRGSDEWSTDAPSCDGIGGSVGVGWETWVSKNWSLGLLFNFDIASLNGPLQFTRSEERSSDSESITAIAPALLFSATYN
ncbi:MAG: autotransporter outer membrane beta-barrel domain-containing protein [Polyangiaceae bacterium]|nr:autotransporter outer membrane beta-barrel domain-containing protein [Polyangiaceae bacterium]